LNIFAIQIYGEAEFIFASVKIITIVGLLIMAFIVDLGGGPKHDRLGFRYWKNPGAMKEYDSTGNTGRFLGLFSVLVNAAFSYGGVELVAVAAGEAENPRKNIPKAVRRVFWRILFFYVLGSLAIGVLVASNDPHLLKAQAEGAAGAARSPWVIGIQNAGIPVLPSIINAVILTSASSSANAFLYTGSRYLFALAQNKQAPRFLLRCSKAGVPYYCVAITASISGLTYLSVRSGGPSLVFGWFQNLTTIASLFTWCSICIAYIQFHKALKAQGVDRNTLVFKSRFQPYTAWFAFWYFAMIIVFNGFDVFVGEHHSHWNVTGTYPPLPLSPGRRIKLTGHLQTSSQHTSASRSSSSSTSSGRSSCDPPGSIPPTPTSQLARQLWMLRMDNGPSSTPETSSREFGSGLRRYGGYTCVLAGCI
jgi:amino acid transporter